MKVGGQGRFNQARGLGLDYRGASLAASRPINQRLIGDYSKSYLALWGRFGLFTSSGQMATWALDLGAVRVRVHCADLFPFLFPVATQWRRGLDRAMGGSVPV